MTKQRRARVWADLFWVFVGALALLPFAAGVAQLEAQSSAPATDVFASQGSSSAVYQDSFSSKCDETNHGSLAVDSPDPAVCFDQPAAPNGECSPVGGEDSTPAGQTGNICHYCQLRPAGNVIVVPNDSSGAAYAAYQQGYQCSANPADSCYLTCYGPGTFKPPPGTTLRTGTGTSGTPTQAPGGNGSKPPPLQGFVSNTEPDPCHPAGPKNYYVCDYPNLPRPAGCECSQTPGPKTPPQSGTQPAQKPTQEPTDKESTQTPDPGNYLLGLVAGMLDCPKGVAQGLGTIVAGAGYFGQGDFANAAQTWGLAPGQSVALKVIYAELTTPQINVVSNGSTSYSQGVIAGRRICGYVIVPSGIKTVGNVLKGGTTAATTVKGGPTKGGGPSGEGAPSKGSGSPEEGTPPEDTTKVTTPPEGEPAAPPEDTTKVTTPPEGKPTTPPEDTAKVTNPAENEPTTPSEDTTKATNPPEAGAAPEAAPEPPASGPGSSESDPLKGMPLVVKLSMGDPLNLAGDWVKLGNQTIKLGKANSGSLAGVYEYGEGEVIKLSRGAGTSNAGKALAGQYEGAKILKSRGIATPDITEFNPGNASTPASMVAKNLSAQFPKSKVLSRAAYQKMTPELQGAIKDALADFDNTLGEDLPNDPGNVSLDINPSNFSYQDLGNGTVKLIQHDPDMIMTVKDLNALPAGSQPLGVLDDALKSAGLLEYSESQGYTAPTLGKLINQLRQNFLETPPNGPTAAQ
jgi:hypothetical protein